MLGAYMIHIYAGRTLGTKLYGTFGVTLSILTICYIFLNDGVRQAISKIIAVHLNSAKKIFYKGFFVQLCFAFVIALMISCFAGGIADFFRDDNLIMPLRICGAIILTQGIFNVSMGALNGMKRFLAENVLLIIYSIVRPAAAIFLIGLGFGISGALFGFLTASAFAAMIGFVLMVGASKEPCNVKIRDVLKSAIANVGIFASMAVLMNIDLLFVKRFMAGIEFSGLYTAASAFSKPPYLFLFAFGSVVLPLTSSSFGRKDLLQCRLYHSQVLRYSTLIFLPAIVLISSTSEELIVFFYNHEYGAAGYPLSILIFGNWLIGLNTITAHIMIGIGRELLMVIMSILAIILDVALNIHLIPKFGLKGAAIATSLSAFMLLLTSEWYLIRKIGLDITTLTVFRLTGLLTLLYIIPQISLFDEIPLLVEYIILYAGFGLALILTREIGPEDWIVIKRLVQSRA